MLVPMRESSCAQPELPGPFGLSPSSRRVVRAFCEALLCDADAHGRLMSPSSELVEDVVLRFDKQLGAGSGDLRRGINLLCGLMERMPLVIIGSPSKMTELTLSERVAFLETMENARVGLVATMLVALKVPLTMHAYERTDMLKLTGFNRSSLKEPRGDIPIPEPPTWAERGGRP